MDFNSGASRDARFCVFVGVRVCVSVGSRNNASSGGNPLNARGITTKKSRKNDSPGLLYLMVLNYWSLL